MNVRYRVVLLVVMMLSNLGLGFSAASPDTSTAEKTILPAPHAERYTKISYLFDNGDLPTNKEDAEKYIEEISVPIWVYNTTTQTMQSSTKMLKVHKKLKEDVLAIFTEIHNHTPKFPIASDSYGYSFRGNSADFSKLSHHSYGTAIDINPSDNPQVNSEGTILRPPGGRKYDPENNLYSIPSWVVTIFNNHGWTWGETYPTKDYMHFSYLGG